MKRTVGAGLALLALLAACGDAHSGPEIASGSTTEPVTVVASFYPVYEAVWEVGGELVEVRNLTPAGVEPHDLELTPKQVDRLLDADLVVYLGRGFQPAVERVVDDQRDGASLDVLDGLKLRAGSDEEAALDGGLDPHVWLDPTLMARIVDEVEAALAQAAPGHAEEFAGNADVYRAKVGDLHSQYADGLADCERRDLVTSHSAFGYLARRYGLRQHGIAGLSPEAEPDPAQLADLADEVKATGTTTVFSETLAPRRVAETLAREAGVKTALLNPLESLDPEEAEAGATYLSVMQANLAALRSALGCGA